MLKGATMKPFLAGAKKKVELDWRPRYASVGFGAEPREAVRP
jgi:hypothetical protein